MIINRYQIVASAGCATEVGRLVSAMDRVRERTVNAVNGLSIRELDHLHDAHSDSIGALLMHIAAVETFHGIVSFENRMPRPEEYVPWHVAFTLGDQARAEINGKPLSYYLETLDRVRETTRQQLRARPDAWLLEQRTYVDHEPANNWYIWFHVPEDETGHRTEISWLRRRLP